MTPEAIRAAHPKARFIARAWIPSAGLEIPDRFAPVVDDQVWGIAVDLDDDQPGDEIMATADDGRSLRVVLAEPVLGGDAATVLANARYWELSPAFVDALKSVVQPGQDEE